MSHRITAAVCALAKRISWRWLPSKQLGSKAGKEGPETQRLLQEHLCLLSPLFAPGSMFKRGPARLAWALFIDQPFDNTRTKLFVNTLLVVRMLLVASLLLVAMPGFLVAFCS